MRKQSETSKKDQKSKNEMCAGEIGTFAEKKILSFKKQSWPFSGC
jgi:hypothetical protein